MFEKLFKSETAASPQQQATPDNDALHKELEKQMEQLSHSTDQAELAKLAIAAAFTKVRQAAAERISNSDALHQVEKESSDKAVQHIVREKLKYLKQAQEAQERAQEELELLCKKLEQLASSSHTPLFKQQVQHIYGQWQEHGGDKSMLQERFAKAHQRCDAVLAEISAEEARIAAEEEALKQKAAAEAAEAEAKKAIWAQVAEEQQLEQQQAAEKKQHSEEQKKAHAKEQAQLEQSLKDLLALAEATLQEGHVSNAAKKLKSAQQKFDALDKKTAHHYESKLQLLHKQLNELRDWQGYAALPKKQELCEKMQKLIGVDLPPQALADAIHELQEQWRALKGGNHPEEQKCWLQFKEAADKAYEPCKVFFEQQKNVRQENLRQRETICAALENYYQTYNWSALTQGSAEWKAVDKIIETAKNEFHRFSPVDHKHQAAIKDRYDAALKPIIEKIRAEQKANETHKQQLIAQAQKLLEQDDIQSAIESAKQLQLLWKTSGVTRPREDQKLWQQFRNACDAIFARRSAAKEQAQENLKQDINKAEELCKQVEALAALPDAELQKSKDAYAELRKQFLAISSLSKEKHQKIFRHFYKVCDHYQERVAGIKDRKQQSALQEAFSKANICAQLEDASLSADDAQTQWAALTAPLSAEHNAALEKRFANAVKIARGEQKIDFTANDKARRLILIRLEILKNKETPAEDKALRMEFSLKQLSGGLGQKVADPKQEQQTLTLEWLSAPVGLPEYRDALQNRFDALVK